MTNDNVTGLLGSLGALLTAGILAWAASDHGLQFASVPVVVLCVVFAFAVQWLVFVHAWLAKTEKYFDLTGSLTYIVMIVAALAMSGKLAGPLDVRSLVIGGLVLIWALRLGPFLFLRIRRSGEDRRFRSIKQSFALFFMTWTLQGTWVFVTASCALAAITGAAGEPLGILFWLGLLLWLAGFTVEVVADVQKTRFRAQPENKGDYITTGLWAWSRHPNYFGEIVLWCGIALMALPVLQGWQFATLISPAFVVLLLTKISGVRMLENRADKQWGDDPEYQAYKRMTPTLIPMPPRATA